MDLVELLNANPSFSKVRYPDGRESTVSTGDLADPGMVQQSENHLNCEPTQLQETNEHQDLSVNQNSESSLDQPDFDGFEASDRVINPLQETLDSSSSTTYKPSLRRSSRMRKPPDRLNL